MNRFLVTGSTRPAKRVVLLLLSLSLCSLLSACSLSKKTEERPWLVLATTQDLNASGLLDIILPPFEQANKVRIKRLPVSYSQALAYAHEGGVDLLLTEYNTGSDLAKLAGPAPEFPRYNTEYNDNPLAAPAPASQPTQAASFEAIMAERKLAFWSDLVLVGPANDPGGVGASQQYNAGRALKWIALNNLPFVVAGDAPGLREQQDRLWRILGQGEERDRGTGYRVIAGDARAALKEAEVQQAYTIVPYYLYLNNQTNNKLKIILQGDPAFFLGYEIAIPNTIRIQDRDVSQSRSFTSYLIQNSTQAIIYNYHKDKYPNYLFRPWLFQAYRPA